MIRIKKEFGAVWLLIVWGSSDEDESENFVSPNCSSLVRQAREQKKNFDDIFKPNINVIRHKL
ncbi:hypothetical protein BpHYR1_005576 [Brachionus plicatilis]|uniref:Uncharacterized protein n=1 Tax=Brachionus plicatilis TaxID=10195 RepID=A0A3M7SM93_BRAPC|nr:hypothetical protein BpHYR1_005576 [Brachionus plicatilis]